MPIFPTDFPCERQGLRAASYNNTHSHTQKNTWPHTPHHGPHHILHPAETRLLLSGSSSLISRKGPVDEGWVSLEGGYCVSTELSVSSPCNHDEFVSAGLRLMLNSAVTLLLHQGFDWFREHTWSCVISNSHYIYVILYWIKHTVLHLRNHWLSWHCEHN